MSTDPNEKYAFGIHCNEDHSQDERPEGDAELNNPAARHRDQLLDAFCDTHPGHPMCKVFDD